MMSNTIKFPNMFSSAAGKIQLVSGADEAKQCMKCALHTVRGELFGDPQFGCNIRRELFEYESAAVLDDLKEHIVQVANKYARGIQVQSITFNKPDTNSSRFEVTIYYYLKSLGKAESTTLEY